jgi:hypothetical protein
MDTSDLGAEWLVQLRVRAQVSGSNPSSVQRAKNSVTCDFSRFKKITIFSLDFEIFENPYHHRLVA